MPIQDHVEAVLREIGDRSFVEYALVVDVRDFPEDQQPAVRHRAHDFPAWSLHVGRFGGEQTVFTRGRLPAAILLLCHLHQRIPHPISFAARPVIVRAPTVQELADNIDTRIDKDHENAAVHDEVIRLLRLRDTHHGALNLERLADIA